MLEAAALRVPTDVLTYLFFLSRPAACSQRNQPLARTSLDAMHTRQVPNSCLLATGWVPERRGGGGELDQKQEPILHLQHSPALWLLPKARPSSALGNKYLYGDNYSIWEENPIKQEPCRAANAGTVLEAATPPNALPAAPDNG